MTWPPQVTQVPGQGGLPMVAIRTDRSCAEIYLHGAQVTRYDRQGQPPLLFMSRASRFAIGQPIRGGVPIVFPWFGPRTGEPAHGFARLVDWTLDGASVDQNGDVTVRLGLPVLALPDVWRAARVQFVVTIGDVLTMALVVTNQSAEHSLRYESCLHTYFAVGDIDGVSITGLEGAPYLDKVGGSTARREGAGPIIVRSEVDRVFQDATGTVEIRDAVLGRTITIDKTGSASTVVWNPWVEKSIAMPDFGDDEFRQMVCVESGNVADHAVELAPGQTATMVVRVSSRRALNA